MNSPEYQARLDVIEDIIRRMSPKCVLVPEPDASANRSALAEGTTRRRVRSEERYVRKEHDGLV